MTKTKAKNEDAAKVAGIDIKDVSPGTTLVVLPNNSKIPLDNLDFELAPKRVLQSLRAISSDTQLAVSEVDKDETSDEHQVRVITLKSNARSKG